MSKHLFVALIIAEELVPASSSGQESLPLDKSGHMQLENSGAEDVSLVTESVRTSQSLPKAQKDTSDQPPSNLAREMRSTRKSVAATSRPSDKTAVQPTSTLKKKELSAGHSGPRNNMKLQSEDSTPPIDEAESFSENEDRSPRREYEASKAKRIASSALESSLTGPTNTQMVKNRQEKVATAEASASLPHQQDSTTSRSTKTCKYLKETC